MVSGNDFLSLEHSVELQENYAQRKKQLLSFHMVLIFSPPKMVSVQEEEEWDILSSGNSKLFLKSDL